MKVDYEEANRTMRKLREADYDLSVLFQSERDNLLALLDEFIEAQGWDLEELKLMARQYQN